MAAERDQPARALARAALLSARNALVPERHGHGWLPFVLLIFLLPIVFRQFSPDFMAIQAEAMPVESLPGAPSTVHSQDEESTIHPAQEATLSRMEAMDDSAEVPVTHLQDMAYNGRLTFYAIPLFLLLYFLCFRSSEWLQLTSALAIAVLGSVLLGYDLLAIIYLCYAAAIIGMSALPLRIQLPAIGLLLLAALLGTQYMNYGGLPVLESMQEFLFYDLEGYFSSLGFGLPLTTFCFAHVYQASRRKDRQLLLSRQETSRMAALAERERIARDLHDLLGHTLSLIALKADLARKLLAVDPHKAGEEITEVAKVSRQALSEVREAITGMRNVAIAGEAASMQTLLEGSRIALHFELKDIAMAEASQQALAMALREAATNIHRHSRATQAWVTLDRHGQQAQLEVKDNGVGGEYTHGNGLQGMAERLRAIGGGMEICVAPGNGTLLRAWAPLQPDPSPKEET